MKQIRVLVNYGSRRLRPNRIAPGVYNAGDPRLFGLAEYLVANGHAVEIASASASSETKPLAFPVATIEYDVVAGEIAEVESEEVNVDTMLSELVEDDGVVISEVDEMNADDEPEDAPPPKKGRKG